jgi:hypothetical protein
VSGGAEVNKPGYLVMADGIQWTATSIQTGTVASDPDPARALTECCNKEKWNQAVEQAKEHPPVMQGRVPYGLAKHPVEVAVAMAMTFLSLTLNEISGPERYPPVVQRRAIAWYLLWHHGNGVSRVFSAPQVAEACRRPNHSTIMTACNRVLPLTLRPEWKLLLAAWERCVRYGEIRDCTKETWFKSLCGVFGGAA